MKSHTMSPQDYSEGYWPQDSNGLLQDKLTRDGDARRNEAQGHTGLANYQHNPQIFSSGMNEVQSGVGASEFGQVLGYVGRG